MKKILPILFLAFLLGACQKEYLVPEGELPEWLKKNIEEHKQSIEENPKSMAGIAAWKRTVWKQEYYYEYINPLLSSMQSPISHSGDTLEVYVGDVNTDYHRQKCCMVYVWKGPDYIEIFK